MNLAYNTRHIHLIPKALNQEQDVVFLTLKSICVCKGIAMLNLPHANCTTLWYILTLSCIQVPMFYKIKLGAYGIDLIWNTVAPKRKIYLW